MTLLTSLVRTVRPATSAGLTCALLCLGGPLSLWAQTPAAWPAKPIHLIVGFAAGGPTDVVARSFADAAAKGLAQPVVVENKPGANSILAAQAVASAPPDGYTLLFGATNHAMIPALYGQRVKFDALRSFKPLCTLASAPTVLVVGPSVPAKSLAEFLALAKARSGALTYASAGQGSSGHFYAEQFARLSRISLTHIPYKGAAPAVNDLMAGQVDASFATLGSVLPHVLAGKLRALAISSPRRSQQLPQVPTFEEVGVKGYSADAWYGVLAPEGVSAAVQRALEKEAQAFGKSAPQMERLKGLGMEPHIVCGEAFATQVDREITLYTEIARDLNLKAE